MNFKIFLSPPFANEEEILNCTKAIKSGWISSSGSFNEEFNLALQNHFKTNVLLTNSGTSALHLAIKLAGIKQNDNVLCSNFTFAASAFPILYEKANPVLIGSETKTWNISVHFLEEAYESLKKKPKALILTHIYGMPANLKEILKFCTDKNIILIEDAAEAMGSTYNNKALGTFGDYGILSFNGNKIITTSAGGALLVKDQSKYKLAKKWASQSKENTNYYSHNDIGYNYLQSNVLSAIGLAQFQKLEYFVERKREIFNFYKNELESHLDVKYQIEENETCSNYWLSSFIFSTKDIQKIKSNLENSKIESRYLFNPLNKNKVFSKFKYYGSDKENTFFQNGLSLPSGIQLNKKEQLEIIKIIKNS